MADAKGAYIGGVPVQFKDAAAREMISDEYNSAETYAKGNLCIYNGKIYEAIKETIGTWDATAWKETTLAEVNAKMRSDITNLTEKTKKYPDKRAGNVKIEAANTYQKIVSSDTLPAGIYIAVATSEALKDDDSTAFVGWLSIPFPGDTPLTGDANAVNFPSRGRYPTIYYTTVLELKKSDQISVYVYSGVTTVNFNVSLKVTRLG